MKRRSFFGTAIALAAPTGDWDILRRMAAEAVANRRVPGVVIAVAKEGQPVFVHTEGWAVLEPRRPMREDDMFMIASSSKPIAATVVLTLVRHKELRLDDQVSRFFPGSPIKATIRQLLSHTSGIFGNDAPPELVRWIRDFDRPLGDAVKHIAQTQPVYEPGTKFAYGGASFCVAGGIVEKITGQDFDKYAKAAVFEPLGMTETCYRSAKDLSSRTPVIYDVADSFRSVRAVMETPDRRGPRAGGFVLVPGGIYSNARELLRFLATHLREDAVLTPELFAEMRRKQTGSLDVDYGLGWYRYRALRDGTAASVGHGGAYGTEIWIDRERRLVGVVLTQTLRQKQPTLQKAIRDATERLLPAS